MSIHIIITSLAPLCIIIHIHWLPKTSSRHVFFQQEEIIVPELILHVGKAKNLTLSDPTSISVVACSRTRWHTLSRTFLGHMAQNKVKEKYANARGCVQPHALASLFPILFWAAWPRQVGESYAYPCRHTNWQSVPLLLSGPRVTFPG